MKDDFRDMVMDYMNRGFLENILSMIRQDKGLASLIPEMIQDERIRVRIGAVTLVEDLYATHPDLMIGLIPEIGKLIHHDNPTVRGDAASALEIIQHPDSLAFLHQGLHEKNPQVLEVIQDAVEALEKKLSSS